MISAFGIEHVSKSFVGGKFVRASALTAKQTQKIRTGGQYKKARGTTKGDKKFKTNQTEMLQAVRDLKPGESSRAGLFHSVSHKGHDKAKNTLIDIKDTTPSVAFGGSLEASAQKFGAKRGGVNVMTTYGRGEPTAATLKHEKAHLAPKRSGYRLKQIASNPKKIMREEARADAVADKTLKRPNPFKRPINDLMADPSDSGYAQAAAGRHHSRSSEHVGSTRAGSAAKKIPGLRKLVSRADEHVRGQYDAQIVKPSLASLNRTMKTKKPVKRKHLDEYKNVYDKVRG